MSFAGGLGSMHAYQRINLQGDIQDCMDGVRLLAPDFNFDLSPDGLLVHVEQHAGSPICVNKRGDRAEIRYSERAHFFRGLGLLLEELGAGSQEISITEVPQFTTNGAMFDVSQNNAVPQVATVKNILKRMAMMGLNMFMLYTEDNYVVEGEPYFGYMRGRYTADELKECDDFAALFGIEMIPCMQTLAHLTTVLQWPAYAAMKDDDTTLLVGNEKVYEFVERLVVAASEPFRSKRIHIGMDEALRLGLGAYFRQHGLRSKFDLMNEHLARVLQIVEKHGLKPMIWSDMYFRAASKTGGYYDLDAAIPPHVLAAMPAGVQLVYWDYYHYDEGFYREYIKRHREFGSDPIFAGGIWNWTSFAVNWNASFRTTNAALNACKQEGIREVFATTWGGYGSECHIYATLLGMQLFAEHGYAEGLDQDKLQRRFEFCTGACYDDFINIKYLDEIPGAGSGNASKFLMYQDLLMGLFDKHLEGVPLSEHYAQLTQTLQAGCGRNGQYNMLFEYVSRVSRVLSSKAEMGLRLTQAYRAGDREALRHLADTELPELAARVKNLRDCHRDQWLALYKPFGWDVLDMRYGALLARIDSAITLVGMFLDGRLSQIEELDEERLYFNGRPGMGVGCYVQGRIVSGSQMVVR
jgi:hexosaminidase